MERGGERGVRGRTGAEVPAGADDLISRTETVSRVFGLFCLCFAASLHQPLATLRKSMQIS